MFPKKKEPVKNILALPSSVLGNKSSFDHVKRCLSLPAQCAHKMK